MRPTAIIVGDGYVGRAATWWMIRAGYRVIQIDDRKPSGTRPSLGLWRESWWESEHFAAILPSWWEDRHLEASMEYLDALCGQRTPVYDDTLGDWANEGAYLFAHGNEGGNGEVERIVPGVGVRGLVSKGGRASISFDGGKRIDADVVVVCAGVRNYALWETAGIPVEVQRPRSVAGRALVFDNSEPFDIRSKTTPYGTLYAVRLDPISVAIGSSYQDDWDPSGSAFEKEARAWAKEMGSGSLVREMSGLRDVGADGKLYVWHDEPDDESGPTTVFLGGSDRFGLGVCGGLGLRLLEVLDR